MTRNTYDPGTPGTITAHGKGRYTVQSFRDRSASYEVDLRARTCTCPDATRRERQCKHMTFAMQESFRRCVQIAAGLSVAELHYALKARELRPEQAEAIRQVLERRAERLVEGF